MSANVRDCREPEIVELGDDRLLLIDQAALDIIRGRVPLDEPAPAGLKIHGLRPLRFSFASRPRAGGL